MLQIRNLSISHKKDSRNLVEAFSIALNPGDKAVMIGEEGNGKSTLLKWIYDPEMVSDYTNAEGERIAAGERLGYLPQELSEEDANKTVYEFFSQTAGFWDKNPKEQKELTGRLLLPHDFFYREQMMGSLSGGEKIKAQLLKILIQEPTVLLLDEPSNDIDIHTLEWLEQFILSSKQTILFVSHDEVLIEKTANVIIHLEQIRKKSVCRHTVLRMSYAEYEAYRESNLRNQEALALTQRRELVLQEEKFRRIQQKVEHAQNAISRGDPHGGRLLKKKMHAVKAMEARFDRKKKDMAQIPDVESAMFLKFGDERSRIPSGKTVIDLFIKDLMCPDGSRILSKNIRLFVRGSEKICILGDNGVGKSTLIRKIAEELLSREDIHAEYMPQTYRELLDEEQTPVDYLSTTGDKEEITRIRTYLGSMKYTADEMNHRIGDLSGGQKAKVLLLKMSLSGANVLILDEPTRNFSPLSGPMIRKVLREYEGAIISVSHDRKYISEVCDKLYMLTEDGLKETHL